MASELDAVRTQRVDAPIAVAGLRAAVAGNEMPAYKDWADYFERAPRATEDFVAAVAERRRDLLRLEGGCRSTEWLCLAQPLAPAPGRQGSPLGLQAPPASSIRVALRIGRNEGTSGARRSPEARLPLDFFLFLEPLWGFHAGQYRQGLAILA